MRETGLANYLASKGMVVENIKHIVQLFHEAYDEICFPNIRKYDKKTLKNWENMTCIKKVKVLTGSLKKEAEEKKLGPEDLVIVKDGHIEEKVEGDPVTYLLNRANS